MIGSESPAVPVDVQVVGARMPRIAALAEEKVRAALRHAHGPVLHARAVVVRHHDPAVARPFAAQATVDVDGRLVRAEVSGATATEALDALKDRLRRRLEHDRARAGGHWEDRRGARPAPDPHEWRHGGRPTLRSSWFPRPPSDRRVIHRLSTTPGACGVDEAAFDMELADQTFHLFTEIGSGQDSVLYRPAPADHRLAQVQPRPDAVALHVLPVEISPHPAPVLSTAEAVERMTLVDVPFLFFLDGGRGRGAVLHHRYDGHYGLITPAD